MKKYVYALIKITDTLDHAQDFCDGLLFCNRVKYFIGCEKKEIGDAKEAIAYISQHTYKAGFIHNRTRYNFNHQFNIDWQDIQITYNPAFCMYAVIGDKNYLRKSETIKLFNTKLKKFGDFAVIVKDVPKFLTIIQSSLPNFQYSLIGYLDYSKPLTPPNPIINKDYYFNYQNEFRIYSQSISLVNNETTEVFGELINKDAETFPFSPINGITSVVRTSELFDGVKVQLNRDYDSCDISKLDFSMSCR